MYSEKMEEKLTNYEWLIDFVIIEKSFIIKVIIQGGIKIIKKF